MVIRFISFHQLKAKMKFANIFGCKIIFICTLLILFIKYFGLPSFNRYLEKRVVFTDELVNFEHKRPPGMIVAHASLAADQKNAPIIKHCLNLPDTEANYQLAVECINGKLTSKEKLFMDAGTTDLGFHFYDCEI